MGSAPGSAPMPVARLVGVGAVIFFANAALLVLQLIASRLLAPFIGSDLYTWTSIIGVFLTGIALGNAYGGRIADRYPTPRTLALLLILGAIAAGWMALAPEVFRIGSFYKAIPLGPRIPILALAMCLPAGFILSLLTPLAIKLGLPDLSKTGRVAGLIFSLSTLGCLAGNYVTGFYLVPAFRINELVFVAAGILVVLAVATFLVLSRNTSTRGGEEDSPPSLSGKGAGGLGSSGAGGSGSSPFAFRDIRVAYLIVFLASFCGMTLELVASRLIAPILGQSLFTWTGVIGVMLAGTALGNLTGGILADRANSAGGLRRAVAWLTAAILGLYVFALVAKGLKPLMLSLEFWDDFGLNDTKAILVALAAAIATGFATYTGVAGATDDAINPRIVLTGTLIGGGAAAVLIFIAMAVMTRTEMLDHATLVQQVLVWTFALFFLPMFMLGMVSPQVIRLSVPDVGHVGRVAGRIYAWSTAGAIAGTFATGYLLISAFGTYQTTLGVALVLTLTSLIVAPVWRNNVMLYVLSIVLGGITGGMILSIRPGHSEDMIATVETNYYTIKVTVDHAIADADGNPRGRKLTLDHLVHSSVDPDNPTYIYYEHEYIQLEFLRGVRARTAKPHVLVVGGGGYTFPRYAMEVMPEASMDVVEIDPGVTKVAREYLGLKDYPGLNITHMDGRQFVAERAAPQSYDLVIQDAVNDLSVPSHLMTKEYNDAVKAALNPRDGVYLLTIIDEIEHGKLWKAAMATLRQSFPHVTLLTSADLPDESPPANASEEHLAIWKKDRENWERTRQVYVIYAADHPLDVNRLRLQNAERFDFTPKAAVTGLAMASFSMPFFTHPVADRWLEPHLQREPGVVLTDQFAPVDNLMADVFRRRDQ